MTPARLERFERSLRELGASAERVDPDATAEALEEAVDEPAVGVPIEGVSLPDGVETDPTPSDLEAAVTGITPAAFGIAETGTVALPSTAAGIEPVSLYPERHVAVLEESQLLETLSAGLERVQSEFARGERSLVFATGRSSTADMGALVHGVHGPRSVHVLVLGETDE